MQLADELHAIAAAARVGACTAHARRTRLARTLTHWRQKATLLAFAEHHATQAAEIAALASMLANARVTIVQLCTENF